MKPIEFLGVNFTFAKDQPEYQPLPAMVLHDREGSVNFTFAKDQPEYQPLPAMVLHDREGSVITCWELTDEEIEEITKTRKLYLKQLTFGNPLQPILPTVDLSDGIELI